MHSYNTTYQINGKAEAFMPNLKFIDITFYVRNTANYVCLQFAQSAGQTSTE